MKPRVSARITNLGTCLKNLSMQQADHQRRRGGQRGLTLKGLLMGIQLFKYVRI